MLKGKLYVNEIGMVTMDKNEAVGLADIFDVEAYVYSTIDDELEGLWRIENGTVSIEFDYKEVECVFIEDIAK